MFEQASRQKLRFKAPQGFLTVEDLWDLDLTTARPERVACLNEIAKTVSRELKAAGEEDFVTPKANVDTTLQLKFDIVRHVISVRMAENEAARVATARRAQKARILELIAQKQDTELVGKSLDELNAMVAAL